MSDEPDKIDEIVQKLRENTEQRRKLRERLEAALNRKSDA